MAVALHLDESNDASGEVVQENIPEILWGSDDAWDLNPVAFPITPGANSYEKWLRYHVSDLGGASAVGGLKVWGEAPTDAETSLHFNGHTTEATYDGANHKQTAFSAPATTSTRTPEALPTSEPGSANLGIAGDLTGTLAAPGRSDYLLLQVRTTASATAGDTVTISFGYEVTA